MKECREAGTTACVYMCRVSHRILVGGGGGTSLRTTEPAV